MLQNYEKWYENGIWGMKDLSIPAFKDLKIQNDWDNNSYDYKIDTVNDANNSRDTIAK